MTDYTDLKRRLAVRKMQDGEMPNHYVRRMEIDRMEALDAIAALEAEVERYRGHVRELFRICEENEVHDMMLAAVAADLDALADQPLTAQTRPRSET